MFDGISYTENQKILGWEISSELEKSKDNIFKRLKLNRRQIISTLIVLCIFTAVFFFSCWLAGNPFNTTKRIECAAVVNNGLTGTDNWVIIWWVVLAAVIFEFLDASAGMGYGTAFTPLLLLFGFGRPRPGRDL